MNAPKLFPCLSAALALLVAPQTASAGPDAQNLAPVPGPSSGNSGASAQKAVTPTELPHEMIYTNESTNCIERYDRNGKLLWSYPAEIARDVALLPNGNILFCYNDKYDAKKNNGPSGVREVSPDKKVVFEYKTTGQVFSCERLTNGDTLIGNSSQAKVHVVDAKGNLKRDLKIRAKGGHSSMRYARACKNGDILVAEEAVRKIRRYDTDGRLIREISLPYTPFGLIELENGNILVSGRSGLLEYAPDNSLVWEFNAKNFPQLGIRWCAGIQLLPGGNVLVANAGGKVPLFEVARTPSPQIVWQTKPGVLKTSMGHGVVAVGVP